MRAWERFSRSWHFEGGPGSVEISRESFAAASPGATLGTFSQVILAQPRITCWNVARHSVRHRRRPRASASGLMTKSARRETGFTKSVNFCTTPCPGRKRSQVKIQLLRGSSSRCCRARRRVSNAQHTREGDGRALIKLRPAQIGAGSLRWTGTAPKQQK